MRCRKILFGFDGTGSAGTEIDFVSRYLLDGKALLVGALIRKFTVIKTPCKCKGCGGIKTCNGARKASEIMAMVSAKLEEVGRKKGCRTLMRPEQKMNIGDLMQETPFADLFVVSQSTWKKISAAMAESGEAAPFEWECPVLIVPDKPTTFEQVILTYNGSPAAMMALKQFLYMLPELAANLPVTVLATYASDNEPDAAHEKLFIEYLKEHFGQVALHKVDSNTEHTLLSAVGLNEKCLVIINNQSPKELKLLNSYLAPAGDTLIPVELYTIRHPENAANA